MFDHKMHKPTRLKHRPYLPGQDWTTLFVGVPAKSAITIFTWFCLCFIIEPTPCWRKWLQQWSNRPSTAPCGVASSPAQLCVSPGCPSFCYTLTVNSLWRTSFMSWAVTSSSWYVAATISCWNILAAFPALAMLRSHTMWNNTRFSNTIIGISTKTSVIILYYYFT